MTVSTENKAISRRTIAKGAAWTVPVIATAAAAPAASASTLPPDCNNCVQPLVGGGAANAAVAGNRGLFTIANAFTMSLTGCTGLFSIGLVTITQAELTMSDGRTYTTTANLGAGGEGAGITLLGQGVAFDNVRFPSGAYANLAGLGDMPVYPTGLCFTVNLVALGGGIGDSCTQKVCFKPLDILSAAGGYVTPAILGGVGDVAFGGGWGPA